MKFSFSLWQFTFSLWQLTFTLLEFFLYDIENLPFVIIHFHILTICFTIVRFSFSLWHCLHAQCASGNKKGGTLPFAVDWKWVLKESAICNNLLVQSINEAIIQTSKELKVSLKNCIKIVFFNQRYDQTSSIHRIDNQSLKYYSDDSQYPYNAYSS